MQIPWGGRCARKTTKKKRFVLRKAEGRFVVFDRQNKKAISYPIADKKEAQTFCDKFVGTYEEGR